jgi:hypothetical protein
MGPASGRGERILPGCGGSLSSRSDQFPNDAGNLLKFCGFVEKIIRAGGEAFVAILRISVVGANQNTKPGTFRTYRSKYIDAAASRHLQIQDNHIGIHLLDAA